MNPRTRNKILKLNSPAWLVIYGLIFYFVPNIAFRFIGIPDNWLSPLSLIGMAVLFLTLWDKITITVGGNRGVAFKSSFSFWTGETEEGRTEYILFRQPGLRFVPFIGMLIEERIDISLSTEASVSLPVFDIRNRSEKLYKMLSAGFRVKINPNLINDWIALTGNTDAERIVAAVKSASLFVMRVCQKVAQTNDWDIDKRIEDFHKAVLEEIKRQIKTEGALRESACMIIEFQIGDIDPDQEQAKAEQAKTKMAALVEAAIQAGAPKANLLKGALDIGALIDGNYKVIRVEGISNDDHSLALLEGVLETGKK